MIWKSGQKQTDSLTEHANLSTSTGSTKMDATGDSDKKAEVDA